MFSLRYVYLKKFLAIPNNFVPSIALQVAPSVVDILSFRDIASPHTLYARLDKLRVLTFMSAEHDVIVKTLLPN